MASSGGGTPVVGASDLVAQSNEHWNVSGSSVLVAWGLSIAGGVRVVTGFGADRQVLIILLFSWRRHSSNSASFEMIYESRYTHVERLNEKAKLEGQEGVFVPTLPIVSFQMKNANAAASQKLLWLADPCLEGYLDRDEGPLAKQYFNTGAKPRVCPQSDLADIMSDCYKT